MSKSPRKPVSRTTRRKNSDSTALVPKLQRVVSAFGKLTRNEQRQFANAMFSDGGATNPKLGNSSRQSRGADQRPATSQFTSGSPDQADYFRQPRNQGSQYTKEPDASITPSRVTLSVRMRNNPIKGLTFERLVTYLDQWRLGFFRGAGMAWDTMERRDYQLQICRPKRLKSVARHGYDVLIRADIEDAQKALAQEQKDFLDNFYGNLTATTALNPDEEGGFSLLVRQMMDAIGKYYAVHEIVWQPLPDGTLTAKFIFCPIWWFEGTRGKLRFLPSEFQIYGNEMLPGEWMVTCGDGLMEACSVLYLMKGQTLKSLLSFLDKFGMPGIHGKTDAVKDSPEWNAFVQAMEDFSQEWSCVSNRNADISLIEAKSSGDAGFDKALQVFDRAITQLWRGADLGTTSSKSGTGASLQEDESEILETDDAKLIEETLESKVTKFALAWKFGPDAPALAYIKLRTTPRRNIQDDIAVDEFLAGFKNAEGRGLLGTEATLERYSRPVPKPTDDVLSTAAPAAQPGKGPDGKPVVPPGQTDANPEFKNADDALDAKSQELVVEAILSEFRTINERLDAVTKIDDAVIQKQKLAAILADLDKLEKNLNHDPAVAQAIYKVLSANLANAIAGSNGQFANSFEGYGGRKGFVGGSTPRGEAFDDATANAWKPDKKEMTRRLVEGRAAMDRVIRTGQDELGAVSRPGLGDVDFRYGQPGTAPMFKDGSGVSKIIAKRDYEATHEPEFAGQSGKHVAMAMPDTILKGEVGKPYEHGTKVNVVHGTFTAVLSRAHADGQGGHWLLTGFDERNAR